MKRDMSRIFPVLEEEDDDNISGNSDNLNENKPKKIDKDDLQQSATSSSDSKAVPDVVKDAMHARWISRLQSITPASFVIPDMSKGLFPYSTTDNIPDNSGVNNIPVRYVSFCFIYVIFACLF